MDDAMIRVAVFVVIILGAFLLGREIACWYWKVNRIVELLESIDLELKNRIR